MTTALRLSQPPGAGRLEANGWPRPVTDDLAWLRTGLANVYFFGRPDAGDRGWVLIDAGLSPWTTTIEDAAARRFGRDARPAAIVLTHGHFDHVGALETLSRSWDVPVYAHPLEMPYLTGEAPYPPPDPTVGGGAIAAMSWLYPRGPIDLEGRVATLPDDRRVPGMPGWRWLATPGHSPGHISFFRDADRTLVAGDAITTVRQDSALAVLTQYPELHGPPMYYTIDWPAARRSVGALAALEPEVAATGHGVPLSGASLREALHALARDFDRLAVPAHGRYAHEPAIADELGPLYIPPPEPLPASVLARAAGLGLAAGLTASALLPARRHGGRAGDSRS
jgi:glyoxylase-like metal-dependent hydrolase (beta-lactamase superfamily II)